MARSEGKKGRTPREGPDKSRERGSRTSCRKNTNKAQFQGQSNLFETGRHTGKNHWTRKNAAAPAKAAGHLFSEGAVANAIATAAHASKHHAGDPLNWNVARRLTIRALPPSSGNSRFKLDLVSISRKESYSTNLVAETEKAQDS
jgi:hypothetical protein